MLYYDSFFAFRRRLDAAKPSATWLKTTLDSRSGHEQVTQLLPNCMPCAAEDDGPRWALGCIFVWPDGPRSY